MLNHPVLEDTLDFDFVSCFTCSFMLSYRSRAVRNGSTIVSSKIGNNWKKECELVRTFLWFMFELYEGVLEFGSNNYSRFVRRIMKLTLHFVIITYLLTDNVLGNRLNMCSRLYILIHPFIRLICKFGDCDILSSVTS